MALPYMPRMVGNGLAVTGEEEKGGRAEHGLVKGTIEAPSVEAEMDTAACNLASFELSVLVAAGCSLYRSGASSPHGLGWRKLTF